MGLILHAKLPEQIHETADIGCKRRVIRFELYRDSFEPFRRRAAWQSLRISTGRFGQANDVAHDIAEQDSGLLVDRCAGTKFCAQLRQVIA
jgi:hypothetical protein